MNVLTGYEALLIVVALFILFVSGYKAYAESERLETPRIEMVSS